MRPSTPCRGVLLLFYQVIVSLTLVFLIRQGRKRLHTPFWSFLRCLLFYRMGASHSQLDSGPSVHPSRSNPGRPAPPRRPTLGPRPSHPPVPVAQRPGPSTSSIGRERFTRPVDDRPPVQHSGVVENVINVKKNSVQMVPSSEDPNIYLLEFEFDAQVDGFITIYYLAQQVIQRVNDDPSPDAPIAKVSYVSSGNRISGKTSFPRGENQRYRQDINKGLDVRKYSSAQLQAVEGNCYPIVIRLESTYSPDMRVPIEKQVRSQTTFATLSPQNNSYTLQVVGQQVLLNGTIYKILDLYGIGSRNVTATKQRDNSYAIDAMDECVICLTEPCNTAVEPCNHLCLCEDCARTLASAPDPNSRKCPVCRSDLSRLLHFIPGREDSTMASDAGNSSSTVSTARESTSLASHTASHASNAQNTAEKVEQASTPSVNTALTIHVARQEQQASASVQNRLSNDNRTRRLDS